MVKFQDKIAFCQNGPKTPSRTVRASLPIDDYFLRRQEHPQDELSQAMPAELMGTWP